MKIDLLKYKAFVFDLNGTMVNDMSYHIKAWHNIVNNLGANLSLESVKKECYGKNEELLERIFPGRFTGDEKTKLGLDKERQYQQEFKPQLKLIEGLDKFLKQSHEAGVKLAIGSAAIRCNIDFVLDGLLIRKYFDAIVSADDVIHSKPDPETFSRCAEILNIDASDCLVFEDTPKGVETANNAAMDCIVITTMHQPEEFKNYQNVISIINNYEQIQLSKSKSFI